MDARRSDKFDRRAVQSCRAFARAKAQSWARACSSLPIIALALTLLASSPLYAQEQMTALGSVAQDSGQLVLTADQEMAVQLNVVNSVAVLSFERPVEIDVSAAARTLRDYVTLARMDANGQALRLALRRDVSIEQSVENGTIVLTLRGPVSAIAAVAEEIVTEEVVEEIPEPVIPINVTLSPILRPDPHPITEWLAEARPEQDILTLQFSGGEVEIEASVSTRIAVLTFPAYSRLDLSSVVPAELELLEEASESRTAEDGRLRLTLVGGDEVIASHRREGTDLFVAFHKDLPIALAVPVDEASGSLEHAAADVGLEGHIEEAPAEDGVVYEGPLTEAPVELAPPVDEPVILTVEVLETSDSIRLLFPWESVTPAATFRRGNNLWIAFETDAELNIETLERRFRGLFRAPNIIEDDALAILRLEVPNYVLATTSASDTSWIITLGESVVEATSAIEVTRLPGHEDSARVAVALPGASNVHWVSDPDIGDQLAVVTSIAPVRGMITPRTNVEFSLLETAHGLAVESYTDDLRVTVDDGFVSITRHDGLALSDATQRALEIEVADSLRDTPGYMDFGNWRGGEETTFLEARFDLFNEMAHVDESGRDLARLNLVRFYLARGFDAEALGVLHLMESDDPAMLGNAVFRALRGVSYIRLHRFEEGLQDLSADILQTDENAALWRGLARHNMGDKMGARREFSDSARMLNAYGPVEQARFRIAMAEVAMAANDYVVMEDELDNVPLEGVPHYVPVHVELLRGLYEEGSAHGNSARALEHYDHVIESGYEPLVVRGMFRQTRLLHELDLITREETIDRLEAQRYRWRGDDLELAVLQELGRQYVAGGAYREGLLTWRIAITSFPRERRARQIGDEMQETFIGLFLGGDVDALTPIQALGLFYSFRELTPVGRQGDDMIRQLADRLVNVDLLEQAAELLNHQVENRLRGVGRAQVATRLAMVYLLDRRPAEALQAIRSTRQTLLPETLNRQRRILESRSLAALHRYDHALEVIENERREEANRLRAEIQWEAEYWDDAAIGLEELLGSAWRSDQPLNDDQRGDVMRAAISFVFADDELGLTRLRTKFARQMAQSPDAEAFEIVTGRIETQDMAFREMARRIASIDTFDAFMDRIRTEFESEDGTAIN